VIIIPFKLFKKLLYEEGNRVEVSLEDVKRSIDNIDKEISEIVEKTKKGDYNIPKTIDEIEGLLYEVGNNLDVLTGYIKLSPQLNKLSELLGDAYAIPRSIAPYNYNLDEHLNGLDILQFFYYKTFHNFNRKEDIGKKDLIIIKELKPIDNLLLFKSYYIPSHALLELNKRTHFYDYVCFATAFRQRGIIKPLGEYGEIIRERLKNHVEELLAYGKLYADLTKIFCYLYNIYKGELNPSLGFQLILSNTGFADKTLDEVVNILSRGQLLEKTCLLEVFKRYDLYGSMEKHIERFRISGNDYLDDSLKKSIEDSIKGIASERKKLENDIKNDMKEKYNYLKEKLLFIYKSFGRDTFIEILKKLFRNGEYYV
jgi:predicted DNA-binding antitoxin AbrB/MazE fold protein